MKKRLLIAVIALAIVTSGAVTLRLITSTSQAATAQSETNPKRFDDLYVCAMHPYEVSDQPGSCEICGMNLSHVHGHKPGDPMPEIAKLFVDPDSPLNIYEGNESGSLIPITESPWYEPQQEEAGDSGAMSDEEMAAMDHSATESTSSESGLWTCGMHPEVIQDHPGLCPICHMELTPLKKGVGGGTVMIDPVTLQNIGVTTATVERRDLSRTIRSNGTVVVAEENEAILNARISGWVEKLHVARTGEWVRKGEPMLEIYSPELVSTQQEYLLALGSASRFDSTRVKQARDAGKMLVNAAKRRLELWGISEQQIDRLARTGEVRRTLTLVAPSSGNVLRKNVVEGSSVKAGQDLFTIADLSAIWIEAQVYEDEAPWVKVGDLVTVTSPYEPDLLVGGRVDFIYPTVDPASRTLELRIVVANPDLQFKPQMYVDVKLETKPVRKVVAVPNSSLIRSGERTLVFVKRGEGEFSPREVQTGVSAEDYTQVTLNLMAGEEVATSAQFLLDSEARLQEAIQRRIAGSGKAEMGGHQH